MKCLIKLSPGEWPKGAGQIEEQTGRWNGTVYKMSDIEGT